jgi:hypothetical protein
VATAAVMLPEGACEGVGFKSMGLQCLR